VWVIRVWLILSGPRVISNLHEGRMEEDQGTGISLTWASGFCWAQGRFPSNLPFLLDGLSNDSS